MEITMKDEGKGLRPKFFDFRKFSPEVSPDDSKQNGGQRNELSPSPVLLITFTRFPFIFYKLGRFLAALFNRISN